MVLKDLVNAKSISTKGMMTGKWTRTKSGKDSKLVFKSESDPKYTLTFEIVYSVAVEIAGEAGDTSYNYFWDPEVRYLIEKPPVKEDCTLAVEVLSKAVGEENQSNSTEIDEIKEKLRLKKIENDDLKNQLQSVEYICRNQEKNLLDLTGEGKRGEIQRNKDNVKKKSTSNIDPDEKPPFQFLKIPTTEEPHPPPRHQYPLHARPPVGYPDHPPYYPPARPGPPPSEIYDPSLNGPSPHITHQGFETYAHDPQHPQFQHRYDPVTYPPSPYNYHDQLRHGEVFPGYSGAMHYGPGPPPRPHPHEPPLNPKSNHYDQYPAHLRNYHRRSERDYSTGELTSQPQRRGEPIQEHPKHHVSGASRQSKAAQASNALVNIGISKSPVDQMYWRGQPPKSSVPSENPYANVKPPRGNVGPRNGVDEPRKNTNWIGGHARNDHSRNRYQSMSENPYKDVVQPSSEVVEGSVRR